jgi:hypothetical protein
VKRRKYRISSEIERLLVLGLSIHSRLFLRLSDHNVAPINSADNEKLVLNEIGKLYDNLADAVDEINDVFSVEVTFKLATESSSNFLLFFCLSDDLNLLLLPSHDHFHRLLFHQNLLHELADQLVRILRLLRLVCLPNWTNSCLDLHLLENSWGFERNWHTHCEVFKPLQKRFSDSESDETFHQRFAKFIKLL